MNSYSLIPSYKYYNLCQLINKNLNYIDMIEINDNDIKLLYNTYIINIYKFEDNNYYIKKISNLIILILNIYKQL
jgi:hypothetical protein